MTTAEDRAYFIAQQNLKNRLTANLISWHVTNLEAVARYQPKIAAAWAKIADASIHGKTLPEMAPLLKAHQDLLTESNFVAGQADAYEFVDGWLAWAEAHPKERRKDESPFALQIVSMTDDTDRKPRARPHREDT
jgi:hypothetical protein